MFITKAFFGFILLVGVFAQCPEKLHPKAEFNFDTFLKPSIPSMGTSTYTLTKCGLDGQKLTMEATFPNNNKCQFTLNLNEFNVPEKYRLAYEQGFACKAFGMPTQVKSVGAAECTQGIMDKVVALINNDATLKVLNFINADIEECWKGAQKIDLKFRVNNHHFCLGETQATPAKLNVKSYDCSIEEEKLSYGYIDPIEREVQVSHEEKIIRIPNKQKLLGAASECTNDDKAMLVHEMDKSLGILKLNLEVDDVKTCSFQKTTYPPHASFSVTTKSSYTFKASYTDATSNTASYLSLSKSKSLFDVASLAVCNNEEQLKNLMSFFESNADLENFRNNKPKPVLKSCRETYNNVFSVWTLGPKTCYSFYSENGANGFFTCETAFLV